MNVSDELRETYTNMITEVSNLAKGPKSFEKHVTELIESLIETEVYPEIEEWKDRRFFPGFRAKTAEFCYDDWHPRKGDVVVASFLKTGTHWVREIVRQLFFQHDATLIEETKKIGFFYAYLETGSPCKFEIMDNLPFPRRIFGTHMPAELLNVKKYTEKGVKIIYVYRNPKDQLVSFFHFMRSMQFAEPEKWEKLFPGTWNEFFDACTAGEQPVGLKQGESYVDHIMSWYKHYDNDGVHFVKYEDLKKDPHGYISRIADFVDVTTTKDDVTAVVTNTSFKNMKEKAEKGETAAQAGEKILSIFRKGGQTGGWKNQFTVAQSEKVDKMFEKLKDTKISFNY
nr:sulfotransferase 1C2-like isoform X1 [Ciona intestinalis]|eukprot:XP_018670918.1 sulfotransferase 1C2-like isoform X1 [Ciona intestinalis]